MNVPDKHASFVESLVNLDEDTVLKTVEERLAGGDDPLQLLEEAQEGMRLVGLRYEERKYFLSGLMMAGEIFREVMELVEPVLVQHLHGNESGHILIGTVQGDIHDIGKNIFNTVLRCHGFTVTDLGIDTPAAQFVEQALALKPDIIGLCGLLTTSYDVMRATVQQVRQVEDRRVAQTPIMIGGGMVNEMVCAFVGAEYWATDAMYGLGLCKQIIANRSNPSAHHGT